MTAEERLADLDAQVKAQRKRFDEAVSQGMTGAPLARLDQKMARLERERDDLFDKIHAAKLSEPVGNWWAAFDNGEVWPVEVLSTNQFGTRVRATHEAAPQGEIVLPPSRVYDSDFNRPRKVYT